jgi:hypothetical protein
MSTRMLMVALAAAAQATPGQARLIVFDLDAAGDVDPKMAAALSEAITERVAGTRTFEVMGSKDIATLMGAERQRQLSGCSDASTTCMEELTGALGSRFVLRGTLARLGDAFQLTLQTMDTVKGQPLGRATRIAKSLEALQAMLPWVVSEATATPPPPQPSRIVPYTMMGGGGVLLAAGGMLALLGYTNDTQLRAELDARAPGTFDRFEDYRARTDAAVNQERLGGALALVGVGLVATGLWLNPKDPGAGGVALVPTTNGAALVGVFR